MAKNKITTAMSNPEIVTELGMRFKEYRLAAKLTQQEVAEKAGVSVVTLRLFENGKAYNINMCNFLAFLRCVDTLEGIDNLLPDMPISAYEMAKLQKKRIKRIRHGK